MFNKTKQKKYICLISLFLFLKGIGSGLDYLSLMPQDAFFHILNCYVDDIYESTTKDLQKFPAFSRFKNFSPINQLKNEIIFLTLKNLSFVSKENALKIGFYVKTQLKKICSDKEIFIYQIETNKTFLKSSLFSPTDLDKKYYDVQKKIFHGIQWISFYHDFSDLVNRYNLSPYLQKVADPTFNRSSKIVNFKIFNFLRCNKINNIDEILHTVLNSVNCNNFTWFKTYIESNGKKIEAPPQTTTYQEIEHNSFEASLFKSFINQNKKKSNNTQNIINRLKIKKNSRKYKKYPYKIIMHHLIALNSVPQNEKRKRTRIYNFLTQISNYCWHHGI